MIFVVYCRFRVVRIVVDVLVEVIELQTVCSKSTRQSEVVIQEIQSGGDAENWSRAPVVRGELFTPMIVFKHIVRR